MMPTVSKDRNRKYQVFERALKSQQEALRSRLNLRLGDVYTDREPDDEAALASESVTKDMAVATLERERRMLAEVEMALERMKRGAYGVCESCGTPIPDARLQALPWARICVPCAERASSLARAFVEA